MKRTGRKKKKKSFRDRVSSNSHKQKTRSQYGYLSLERGVPVFREEANSKALLDFLPYTVSSNNHLDRDEEMGIGIPGELWYKRPYKIHRSVGVLNDTVVCPTSMGSRCPICEYVSKGMREKMDPEDLRPHRSSLRNLYVVVPIGHSEYDEVPHIWDISQYCFQNMLNEEIEENEEYGAFPDLEDGYTLRIRFGEGAIGKTTFAETSRIDFQKRKQAYSEDIFDSVPDLDTALTILSYKELEKKFFEIDDEDTVDDEDEEYIDHEKDDASSKEEEEEEEEETEFEKRKRERKEQKAKKKEEKKKEEKKTGKKDKDRCPHGHRFDKDYEEFPECDDCKIWEECIDEKERLEG